MENKEEVRFRVGDIVIVDFPDVSYDGDTVKIVKCYRLSYDIEFMYDSGVYVKGDITGPLYKRRIKLAKNQVVINILNDL